MSESNLFEAYSFFGSTAGPHLVITGGVHGDEFEPIAAIRRLVELFQAASDEISEFCGRTTLVPCVNEAAFLRGHRCAEDHLDLARTCPGDQRGSITERVAWQLSELIRSADFYVDLHTGGTEFSLSPLSGYVLHRDAEVLKTQRLMAHAFNLPIVWGTSPDLDGRSLSVARDAHVPAIYCEYLGAATCSEQGVKDYVSGCLNVMGMLKMLRRHPPPNRVEHVVEDPTPTSGHLQVCNPSPATGYFAPAVCIGDRVAQGELIGTVFELSGNRPHTMAAEESGIVLMLRTFPRVRVGETVGVILPLS